MGYDKSLSAEEMIVAGLVIAAASYALYKGLQKSENEERPKASAVKAVDSSNLSADSLVNKREAKQR